MYPEIVTNIYTYAYHHVERRVDACARTEGSLLSSFFIHTHVYIYLTIYLTILYKYVYVYLSHTGRDEEGE